MLKAVDEVLNGITMYRLMLYFLIALVSASVMLSLVGFVPFKPLNIILTAFLFIGSGWLVNKIFSKLIDIPTNLESVYITALILTLIFSPARSLNDFAFLILASFAANASKYILAFRRKHIFNPVAFAAGLLFIFTYPASWWVGSQYLTPVILLGGLLILRKTQRFSLLFAFFICNIILSNLPSGFRADYPIILSNILQAPTLFFAFIMLTEPQTMPPSRKMQIIYGALVGFLYSPVLNFGSFYLTPELSLLLGNVFTYIVSPKSKLLVTLIQKIQLSSNIYDFIFNAENKIIFSPGQYLEWTQNVPNPDSRGNRRYFTIASSPTEKDLRIGIKLYPNPSSFKKTLFSLKPGAKLVAGGLSGEFTLPKESKKLVFIAGGIGITPFRSMIKFLLDTNRKMDIILLYSVQHFTDIVYKEIFDEASSKLGIKTVYISTEKNSVEKSWKGRTGPINSQTITEEVKDFKDRIFYISGPQSMVYAFKNVLKGMGVKSQNIKVDFFPGYV